ncbi:MAG: hypothetical protein WBX25_19865 [Rhodomicrobium sp.]
MPDNSMYSPSKHNPHRVSGTRLFIRALGVSFFSVLSISVAFYAFLGLPQVQDLLFDAKAYWAQEAIYWAFFYAIGIFFWVIPLVFTARLLLLQNFDVIGVDTEERFNFYIFRLPSFFVVLAFLAVFLGTMAAADNLPIPLQDGGNKYEKYIRPLLESHLIALLCATGAVLILVLMRGFFRRGYSRWMERLERQDPEGFKRTLIRIEKLTRKSQPSLDNLDLHLTALKPSFLTTDTWIAAQRVKQFMWRYMSTLTWVLLGLIALHFLSYSEIIKRILDGWGLAAFSQQSIMEFILDTLSIKRAAFLFVVFGAWLPFVTILAALSNRFQFPFITALILIGAGLTLLIGDGHDVRIAKIAEEQQKSLKPVSFADAIKGWKAASGWDAKGCDGPAANIAACPRPIIVAGEGGGSRAAFLTASILGALEDDSRDKVKYPAARAFHNQLFAISSVSGSSVGAALFVSALKARPNYENLEELKKALYRQRLWFPNVATANLSRADPKQVQADGIKKQFLTDFVGYKDALQATLSNDFISPPVVAYLARDILTLSRLPFVYDRAGILERSWEDAFDDVFGATGKGSLLPGPMRAAAPEPGNWMPLLFMNATSIETGRRVILTPVKMSEPIAPGKPLFIDAYDLEELLCSPYVDPNTGQLPQLSTLDSIARLLPSLFSPVANAKCDSRKPKSVGIRLSTAAGVSARSPFVSPHAVIRDTRAQITDSAVDGGYFDNSGVVTAMEIAQALKQAGLRPFILQISSEPDWFKNTNVCDLNASDTDRPLVPDESDFRPLSAVTDLLTVNSTRIARGYETILQLPNAAKAMNDGAPSVAQISICPQQKDSFFWSNFSDFFDKDQGVKADKKALRIRERQRRQQARYKSVSLSWWLSPPLQAFLDGQIYSKRNDQQRKCVLALLQDGGGSSSPACQ